MSTKSSTKNRYLYQLGIFVYCIRLERCIQWLMRIYIPTHSPTHTHSPIHVCMDRKIPAMRTVTMAAATRSTWIHMDQGCISLLILHSLTYQHIHIQIHTHDHDHTSHHYMQVAGVTPVTVETPILATAGLSFCVCGFIFDLGSPVGAWGLRQRI